MANRNPEEIERCDKREAAIHEAGHLTAGLALGVHGSAWVYRSQTIDPENEKLWVGKRETHDPITAAVALREGAVAIHPPILSTRQIAGLRNSFIGHWRGNSIAPRRFPKLNRILFGIMR
jgi:hypothetical protein